MLSVNALLSSYKGHLPQGWSAKRGLRGLFPADYNGSISILKHYIYFQYNQLNGALPSPFIITLANGTRKRESTPLCPAACWLMADGSGNWFFGWNYGNSPYTGVVFQAGFLFKSAVEGNVRGYVDRSNPAVLTTSCNAGSDPLIAKHWPQLFSGGAKMFFQIAIPTESAPAPDPSHVWNGSSFDDCASVSLKGSHVATQGSGSGSSLFPFATMSDWKLSAMGALLGPMLTAIAPIIKNKASKLSTPFSTADKLNWQLTSPQKDASTIALSFASSDGKTRGSFSWNASDPASVRATGQNVFDIAIGACTMTYAFALTKAATSPLPTSTLTYTVTVKGSAQIAFTATVVDGLVVSQELTTTKSDGSTETTKLSVAADGSVSASGSTGPSLETALLAFATSPSNQVSIVTAAIAPALNLVQFLSPQVLGPVMTDTLFGPMSTTVTVDTAPDGTVSSYFVVGTSADFPGLLTVSMTVNEGNDAFYDFQFPVNGGTWALTAELSYAGGLSPVTLTTTQSFTSDDGTTISLTTSSTNLVATSVSSTATDAAGNSSTTQITFNNDGSSTIEIRTLDAQRNGTLETISCDSDGNATSDSTVPVGSGSVGIGDSDGDDDGDGDDG